MLHGPEKSVGWFKGKITGHSHISWESMVSGSDFPLCQPIGKTTSQGNVVPPGLGGFRCGPWCPWRAVPWRVDEAWIDWGGGRIPAFCCDGFIWFFYGCMCVYIYICVFDMPVEGFTWFYMVSKGFYTVLYGLRQNSYWKMAHRNGEFSHDKRIQTVDISIVTWQFTRRIEWENDGIASEYTFPRSMSIQMERYKVRRFIFGPTRHYIDIIIW